MSPWHQLSLTWRGWWLKRCRISRFQLLRKSQKIFTEMKLIHEILEILVSFKSWMQWKVTRAYAGNWWTYSGAKVSASGDGTTKDSRRPPPLLWPCDQVHVPAKHNFLTNSIPQMPLKSPLNYFNDRVLFIHAYTQNYVCMYVCIFLRFWFWNIKQPARSRAL